MKTFCLFCLLAIMFFSSCTSQRTITNNYLYSGSDTSVKNVIAFQPLTIEKGDLLSIKVYSTANGIDPQADAPYNLPEQAGVTSGSTGSSAATGFEVDQNGDIEYPQLGRLHVEGLTREQLADLIKLKLDQVLKQPSVIVRFLNYKITVLGEVRTPGTFTLPTENVTILEALGRAGDITEFGKKNNVTVVREKNGQREIGTVDLTSKDLFNSPYYHLQQNDVVFVEPTGRKIKQQDQQAVAQQIGIFTAIITTVALLLNFIKK